LVIPLIEATVNVSPVFTFTFAGVDPVAPPKAYEAVKSVFTHCAVKVTVSATIVYDAPAAKVLVPSDQPVKLWLAYVGAVGRLKIAA